MRRLDTRRTVAVLLAMFLTLSWATGAFAQQSLEAQRRAVIEGILAETAGDPTALQAAIENIFGSLQGDEAVARAGQIIDALPSELSDAQWSAFKAAISAKAGALVSAGATQSIMAKLAAKESALGKTQLHASVVAEEAEDEESSEAADGGESGARPSTLMSPPQEQQDCPSSSCPQ